MTHIEIVIDELVENFEISDRESCQNMACIFVSGGQNKYGKEVVSVINALAVFTEDSILFLKAIVELRESLFEILD
jgi:hypothetical protein